MSRRAHSGDSRAGSTYGDVSARSIPLRNLAETPRWGGKALTNDSSRRAEVPEESAVG